MPIVSHLWPQNRGTKKAVRATQSANMAIQMPSTPNPMYRPSHTPQSTRSVHMEMVEITMVNRVSPAARRAWGRVKDAGQNTMAAPPCIQMMIRAYRSASAETLYSFNIRGRASPITMMAPTLYR